MKRQPQLVTSLIGKFVEPINSLQHCWRLTNDHQGEIVAAWIDEDGCLAVQIKGTQTGETFQGWISQVKVL